MKRFSLPVFFFFIFSVESVHATQTHGGPEGLLGHQIAHIFFALSMGIFVYWLKERNLIKKTGWRFIQYAGVLLIVWNLDAFLVHVLDEQTALLHIERLDNWHLKIVADERFGFLGYLYYFAKFDHLWSVPALGLLYLGLRRLVKDVDSNNIGKGVS